MCILAVDLPASLPLWCHTDFLFTSQEYTSKALTMSVSTELEGSHHSLDPFVETCHQTSFLTRLSVEPLGHQPSVQCVW